MNAPNPPRGPRHANTWRPLGVTLPGAAAVALDLRAQFALEALLGKGGMGAVFRAQHRDSGLTVAVKVLLSGTHDDAQQEAAFRAEVEALAALDHPHVIAILDAGYLDAAPAEADPVLAAVHGPCLVLEHAGGGSLADRPPAHWQDLHEVVVAVLDALAHAHARGVIHRDLKPANLLRTNDADLRAGLKVADFGIARLFDRSGVSGVVGTPAYMAPEQFEDAALTPATDLYALGCTLYALGCGAPPFTETNRTVLAALHRQAPPPPARWRFAVPEGFDAWVQRLLAKRPADRFGSAAAAAVAFAALGEVPTTPADDTIRRDAPATPTCLSCLTEMTRLGPRTAPPAASRTPISRRAEDDGPAAEVVPELSPVPEDWQPLVREDVLVQLESRRVLRNLGLGLLAVRPNALLGRGAERDQLWQALRTACAERRPVVVRLSGSADLGLGRLARWLGQRAAELGVAVVGPPVARTEVPRVSAVVGPAAVLAHLRTIEAAVAAADGPQVLVVAMASSAWVRTPRHAARIAPLVVAPRGLDLHVATLSNADHSVAVRSMLGLAPATLAPLLRSTEGYPGWARLWLSAWLAEGRLHSSAAGFVLDGDPFVPPKAAVAPWRGLIDEALWFAGDRPDAERAAVADDPAALPPDVDQMLRRLGLLEGEGARTRWTHPGVRHALMGRAADGGRLEALVIEVAEKIDAAQDPHTPIPPPPRPDLRDLLGDLVPPPPTDALAPELRMRRLQQARLQGERWLQVGRPERARPWLRAALESQWPARDLRSLCDVLRMSEACVGVPGLFAEMEARRARLEKVFGLLDQAETRATAALAMAHAADAPQAAAHANMVLAFTHAFVGRYVEAEAHAAAATPAFEDGPADELMSSLVTQMMCRERRASDADTRDLIAAIEGVIRRPDTDAVTLSLGLWCMGRCNSNLDEAQAVRLLEGAIRAGAASEDRSLEMNGYNNLGKRMLSSGRLAESVPLFRRAADLGERSGGGDYDAPRLNLCEALLGLGLWRDAAKILILLRSSFAQQQRTDLALLCDLACLTYLSTSTVQAEFERHLHRVAGNWRTYRHLERLEILRWRGIVVASLTRQGAHERAQAVAAALRDDEAHGYA